MSKKNSSAEADVKPLRLIITPMNYDSYRHAITGEAGGGVSSTQQNPSMSLEEIYFAYAQGNEQPYNVAKREPLYTGDEYIPDFRQMDIEQIRAYREELNESVMERVAAMDAVTRELAIRDGILPQNINEMVPLPPTPDPTPDPVPPADPPQ
ncbi:hypothetical protein [Flyfo microvirus Tbat2_153]|nr:hypothetical protein [Flyfo microvirus Tbat2_153]